MKKIKKDYFVSKMFVKMIVPSVISSLGFAMSDMIDALVVGRRLGATGLAAISLCLPIYMLMNIIMDGFSLGGGVRFSTLVGSGKVKEAKECFSRTVRITLGIGILFAVFSNIFMSQAMLVLGAGEKGTELYSTCISYARILTGGAPLIMLNIVLNNFLRNDDREMVAARGFLIGNITDIVLNVLFVLVFGFGAGGAALSTVIGSAVAVCFYLPAVFSQKGLLRPCLAPFKPIEALKYFGAGFSVSVQNVFSFVFLLVVNRTLISLGGEGAVAIFDVVYNASFFIIYLCEGTAEAAQPLISNFMGEKSEDDCRTTLNLSVKSALVLSFVSATLVFIFSKYIAMLFGIEAELLPMSERALRIYCTGFVFVVLNIIYTRYYQAREESVMAFSGVFLRNFAVIIPCALIMASFGIDYVWFFFPISEIIAFILFYIIKKIADSKRSIFDPERILRVNVTDEQESISTMLEKCDAFCEERMATPTQQYYVRLILEEIVTSIIRNALKDTTDGRIRVTILAMPDGDFIMHVFDNAVEFNVFSLSNKPKKPAGDFDIDEISLKLIKKNTKKYVYRQSHGFNCLTVKI